MSELSRDDVLALVHPLDDPTIAEIIATEDLGLVPVGNHGGGQPVSECPGGAHATGQGKLDVVAAKHGAPQAIASSNGKPKPS